MENEIFENEIIKIETLTNGAIIKQFYDGDDDYWITLTRPNGGEERFIAVDSDIKMSNRRWRSITRTLNALDMFEA